MICFEFVSSVFFSVVEGRAHQGVQHPAMTPPRKTFWIRSYYNTTAQLTEMNGIWAPTAVDTDTFSFN